MTFDAGTKENGHGVADPFDAADNAKAPERTYFGQLFIDMYFCVLEKGVGKVPFDPAQHPAGRKRTGIKMCLAPLASSGFDFTVEREMIAESDEWAKIVLPTIKALGVTSRALDEAFVQVNLKHARYYTDKDTKERKSATTLAIDAIFPDEAACEAAAAAFFGQDPNAEPAAAAGPAAAPAAAAATVAGSVDTTGKAAMALKFLPHLVDLSGGDLGKLAELLEENLLTKGVYTVNSPEVVAILAAG